MKEGVRTASRATVVAHMLAQHHELARDLDEIFPRVLRGELLATKRYALVFGQLTDQVIGALASTRVEPAMLRLIAMDGILEITMAAPTVDGRGVIAALTDRVVAFARGEPPQLPLHLSHLMDVPRLMSALGANMAAIDPLSGGVDLATLRRPLEHLMATLDLTTEGMAKILGVTRQAVASWLRTAPPAARLERILTMDEVAVILERRLRPGSASAVIRRSAPAFDGRTFLDLFKAGQEKEVLDAVRESFDYARTA